MFRSATDHHQGAHLLLVKSTELKMSIHTWRNGNAAA
jgi:hypothetical protein